MLRLRGVLLLLAAPTAVFAQPPPIPEPVEPPPADDPANPQVPPEDTIPQADTNLPDEPTFVAHDQTYTTTTTESKPFSRYGFAISAGGGMTGFTDESARDATRDGGGWDVRAVIGTRMPLAAEISYLGSAQEIDALGVDDNALLIGNGVQANLRLNLTTDTPVQPFLFAGAAWRRYDVANTDTNTSDIADSDDVLELPLGAGVAFRTNGFIIDVRGEYRAATNEDLMPSLSQPGPEPFNDDTGASLHRWGANANIGYEF